MRLLRESICIGLMVVGGATRAAAQLPDSLWISTRGEVRPDRDTYVMVSGVVGGIAGYRSIERRLLQLGHRVVIIDPYLMSIDSADVSFDAMARRVDAQLELRGVKASRVVGHAHGGGVALRLAANAPGRVSEVFLLNVGALEGNRSPVFSSSMRLVALVAHIPGAKRLLRRRIVAGIRENTGNSDWLDDATAHAYSDTPLAHLSGLVGMGLRLGKSEEPEALALVVSRIRVPVTLLLGALSCPASPGADEMTALKPLGTLVRVVKIEGTCHFPHEEAPEVVMTYLTHAGVGAR